MYKSSLLNTFFNYFKRLLLYFLNNLWSKVWRTPLFGFIPWLWNIKYIVYVAVINHFQFFTVIFFSFSFNSSSFFLFERRLDLNDRLLMDQLSSSSVTIQRMALMSLSTLTHNWMTSVEGYCTTFLNIIR